MDRDLITRLSGIFPFIASPSSQGSTPIVFCAGDFDYITLQLFLLYVPMATLVLLSIGCLSAIIIRNIRRKRRAIDYLIRSSDDIAEKDKGRTFMSRCCTGLIAASLLAYSGVVSICLKLLFCVEVM